MTLKIGDKFIIVEGECSACYEGRVGYVTDLMANKDIVPDWGHGSGHRISQRSVAKFTKLNFILLRASAAFRWLARASSRPHRELANWLERKVKQ